MLDDSEIWPGLVQFNPQEKETTKKEFLLTYVNKSDDDDDDVCLSVWQGPPPTPTYDAHFFFIFDSIVAIFKNSC